MNTVFVRPRLDLSYDVIQSASPQLVGARSTLAEAKALGEWAAARLAPCRLTVFGPDGATVVETRDVVADVVRAVRSAGH